MKLSDFDYALPSELIAQVPLEDRASSRMMVLHRREGRWEDRWFRDLPSFVRDGDCLVLNNSRVIPCRLFGNRKASGASVEVLLLHPLEENSRHWKALVRPGRKMLVGEHVVFNDQWSAEVLEHGERGERVLRFNGEEDIYRILESIGHIPLPPYIRREDDSADRERYQTIYAAEPGSVAAPTAGLHFTGELLDASRVAGAGVAYVTLHVGLGTFQPIEKEEFEGSRLHHERYSVSRDSWDAIAGAKRVIAAGTTSVRTVETVAATGKLSGSTDLFIYPGYQFQRTDAMLTNFHLPKTSLLLLVSAFAGKDFTLAAYRHAVEAGYRFFSYGDCMLIV